MLAPKGNRSIRWEFMGSVILVVASVSLVQHALPRTTERFNTVDFDDLDDVELLQSIEDICGIQIDEAEAEKLVTVGDLYDLVREKSRSNTEFDPVWQLVCALVRIQSGSGDEIDRNTTFFAKMAKERSGQAERDET